MANKQSTLTKINVLKKDQLDSLDLSKHIGEIFATTDETNQKTLEFAENVRQKCKNLWDNSQLRPISNLIPNETGFKLINTSTTSDVGTEKYKINLKANVAYTISCELKESTTTNNTIYCRWIAADGSVLWVPNINNTVVTFVPKLDVVGVQFYIQHTQALNTYVTIEKLQIEEGYVATDYQKYRQITYSDDSSVVFAEGERQKSKNLFNPTYELGFYDISNGQPTASSSYKRTVNKMPIKPNTQYIFSTSVANPTQILLFYDNSLNFVSYTGMSGYLTYPFTTPSNAYYFTYYTQASVVADIQIEEGSIATDYRSYNGQITHSNDASVVFAESERQKSKNLFKVNNRVGDSITKNGVTVTINDDYTITFNGTSKASTWFDLFKGLQYGANWEINKSIKLDNTKYYTLALCVLSGTATPSDTGYYFSCSIRNSSGTGVLNGQEMYTSIYSNLESSFKTVTGISELNNGYLAINNGAVYNNLKLGIMICEGSDTEFQSWNGATIREKQLNETVEKRELLYNTSTSINIESSTLTTLQEYFDLFNLDKNKTYKVPVGHLENNNFKTLVGKPEGFANYAMCEIKLEVNSLDNSSRTCYKLLAFDSINTKVAVGYIYKNSTNVSFSGWTIIGG